MGGIPLACGPRSVTWATVSETHSSLRPSLQHSSPLPIPARPAFRSMSPQHCKWWGSLDLVLQLDRRVVVGGHSEPKLQILCLCHYGALRFSIYIRGCLSPHRRFTAALVMCDED